MSFLSELELVNNSNYFLGKKWGLEFGIKIPFLEDAKLEEIKDKDIIYIHPQFFPHFVEDFLPHINAVIKIICGLDDFLLPYLSIQVQWMHWPMLLYNPNIEKIYATNTEISHPKIVPIPLGITRSLPYTDKDRTMMLWTASFYGHDKIKEYFKKFKNISRISVLRKKEKLIYINYTTENTDIKHIHAYRFLNFRRKLDEYLEKLNSDKVKKQTKLLDWFSYMDIVQKYKFCLQPYGTCPNAFRMFECLIVGTIPVFFNSCSAEAYQDLPVLILDNIEELTEEYLEKCYEKIVSREDYMFEKLFSKYWLNRIYNGQ